MLFQRRPMMPSGARALTLVGDKARSNADAQGVLFQRRTMLHSGAHVLTLNADVQGVLFQRRPMMLSGARVSTLVGDTAVLGVPCPLSW